MRILVTGSGGFVGRNLCPQLAKQHTVIATARSQRDSSAKPEAYETRVIPDLAAPGALDRHLSGIDAVIHLAGRAHVLKETADDPDREFDRANVETTREVAAACLRAKVHRLIFLSTAGVHGSASTGSPISENSPTRPHNSYARSKLAAEDLLSELSVENPGFSIVVLRPPLIYGPDPVGNFRSLLQAVRAGFPLPLASIQNRRSLLFVGNLASLIESCLTARPSPFSIYLAVDRETVSTPELIRRMARAAGRRGPVLFPIPTRILSLSARLAGLDSRWAQLSGDFEVDGSRAYRDLGWEPPYTLEQGLKNSIQQATP